MKLSTNVRTRKKVQGTSWTNQSDPSIGTFSAGVDIFNLPEISIWNGSSRYWRTGPWNSWVFIGIPAMDSGNIEQKISYNGGNWEVGWSALETECDVYVKCREYGIFYNSCPCSVNESMECGYFTSSYHGRQSEIFFHCADSLYICKLEEF
ncbi:G-type lectin S-receptor-like serine/threonine-protein kinase At1g11330 [Carya illinoinensis]|uniref:G-type lectin S-receptor-like serine/threonine-protein kinase At1g11330 n=1 Tax=Carya illinoinensis TaxID=32201 RepID=UPI001C7258C9|nr:G-type lectin S-receptor-like serine/threonine-protein kinase At1g11330 [Carya illinoinensis]